jgi:hypothetical protein
MTARRTFATIEIRDVGAPFRTILRPFFMTDDGIGRAVPREWERAALMREGSRAIVEIRSEEDQFAYLVAFV